MKLKQQLKKSPVLKTPKKIHNTNFGNSPLNEFKYFPLNTSLSLHKDEKYAASSLGFICVFRGLVAAISCKALMMMTLVTEQHMI